MNTTSHTVPRIAIQAVGLGLLLMALFTLMWTGIAQGGLQGRDHYITLMIFAALCVIFVVNGIKIFKIAGSFPKFTTMEDQIQGKTWRKWYGLIFGIEGTLIPIVTLVLQFTGLAKFVLPSIALIVGLHFYPMAKIFNRKIDYFLASWTCLVAIVSIFMINNGKQEAFILGFLGIGVALATAAYGLYILFTGRLFISRQLEILNSNKG